MTLFAGIFATSADSIPPHLREELAGLLSRHSADTPTRYDDDLVALSGIDVGALESPGWLAERGGLVSIVAGDARLSRRPDGTRQKDLAALEADWLAGSDAALRRVRGVFSAVHYHSRDRRLTVVTDKLGIRPLYYWEGSGLFVFSTALRVLEQLSCVDRVMDVRGVTEATAFSFPLGARTGYVGIRRALAGERVDVDPTGVRSTCYWRWHEGSEPATHESAQQTVHAFEAAVKDCLGGDRRTLAFLTGGLDSRSIIATLSALGAETRAVTLGIPNTQDSFYAAAFAARARGVTHTLEPTATVAGIAKYAFAIGRIIESQNLQAVIDRPRFVWSGDGGSVGLGAVYFTEEMVRLLQAGRVAEAVRGYLSRQGIGVSQRVLQPRLRDAVQGLLVRSVMEEMTSAGGDPVSAFHLFLMLNDQRHHLAQHFEEIDRHRIELRLPFFDSDFLQSVLRIRIEDRLRHAYYYRVLELMPACATAVPWQVYPGHLPCPVVMQQPKLENQWSDEHRARFRRSRKRRILSDYEQLVRSDAFPSDLLQRHRLRLAGILYRLGLGDYSHVIVTARSYSRFSALSRTHNLHEQSMRPRLTNGGGNVSAQAAGPLH